MSGIADHLAGIERGDVHEPAAGDDLRHGLDAESPNTRGARELGDASSRCSRDRRSAGG